MLIHLSTSRHMMCKAVGLRASIFLHPRNLSSALTTAEVQGQLEMNYTNMTGIHPRYTFSVTHQSQISALEFVPFLVWLFSVTLRGHQSLAKRDLSFLSSQESASAICISELLSCPSMLYVCCLKCVSLRHVTAVLKLMLDFLQQYGLC